MQGRVKWIDETRGFGVIKSEGGKDIFLYCAPTCESFREGEELEFEVSEGGKMNEAIEVHKPHAHS